MTPDQEAGYREYVTARAHSLRGYAYLCCGDWHLAEDTVQTALTRLYRAWHRVKPGTVDAYTRRIITNALIDEKRRAWWRRETVTHTLPDSLAAQDDGAERLTLLDAVLSLPKRQRAAVVLRYLEDQSLDQTADILGCTTQTVKGLCSRGIATLRELLRDEFPMTRQGGRR